MFGFFSDEKKTQKKTEWAVSICHEYAKTCVEVICDITRALRAIEEQKKHGGEVTEFLKPVGRFDPEVSKAVGSKDSIHFWYTFGIKIAEIEKLGSEIGLVLAVRTLMEFMGLVSDDVTNVGENRHELAEQKFHKGIKDRVVKIECASIIAAASISEIRQVSDVSVEIYQYYVCRFPSNDEYYKNYDLLIKENFFQ